MGNSVFSCSHAFFIYSAYPGVKRMAAVLKASAAEMDALELDESGRAVDADRLVEAIKSEWADFVVTTVITGADVPHPPANTGGTDKIANAFKPEIG